MSGVYSRRFISGAVAAGASAGYTVPAGYVAVVWEVSALNGLQTPGTLLAYFEVPAGVPVVSAIQPESSSSASFNQSGRWVASAGEQITVAALVLVDVYVGGILLAE